MQEVYLISLTAISQSYQSSLMVYLGQFSIKMKNFRIFSMRSRQISIPFWGKPESNLSSEHYIAELSIFSKMGLIISGR